jgi:hypothetical protein
MLVCLVFGVYFEERRAFMRARAVARKAPAEPTTASTAVGFSGELRQPVWACSWRVTERKRAMPRDKSTDFFIQELHSGRWHKIDWSVLEMFSVPFPYAAIQQWNNKRVFQKRTTADLI